MQISSMLGPAPSVDAHTGAVTVVGWFTTKVGLNPAPTIEPAAPLRLAS